MFFYYTGASDLEQPQPQIQRSLGGWKSNTVIPNDVLNNLFVDLSSIDLVNGDEAILAVVLKNELGVTASNVSIYADVPSGSGVQFFVSAVTLSSGKMEQIANNKSVPYFGSLVDMTGLSNKRTLISSLATGNAIGIWIRRVVTPGAAPTCDQLYDAYKTNGLPSEDPSVEATTLILEWS